MSSGQGQREERVQVPETGLQLAVRQDAHREDEGGWGLPIMEALKTWAM